jgi:hypothetical protein
MAHSVIPISLPELPPIPSNVEPQLRWWLEQLKLELERIFLELFDLVATTELTARVTKQTVAATFVIDPVSFFLELNAAGAVTSSLTTAIKNGKLGQWLIIQNTTVNAITVKDNANTKLGGADVVLGQNDILVLRWDGVDWIRVVHTNN